MRDSFRWLILRVRESRGIQFRNTSTGWLPSRNFLRNSARSISCCGTAACKCKRERTCMGVWKCMGGGRAHYSGEGQHGVEAAEATSAVGETFVSPRVTAPTECIASPSTFPACMFRLDPLGV